MNQITNKILTEWANDVPNGIPDKTNAYHLVILECVMNKYLSDDIKKSLLQNIRNEYPTPDKDPIKENFIECGMQLIELGELLSEASVFQSKYSDGSTFLLSKSGKEGVSKYSSESLPGGVFTKTKKTDDAIDITHSEGGEEFWVKSENGKVYHIQGKGSVIGKWFLRASKNPSDISFNTPTLEACSLLGMKVDGKAWLNKFNGATEETIPSLVSAFEKECNSAMGSGDWVGNNIKFSGVPLPSIILIASIAAGMSKFVKDKGVGSWNFIHNKIDTYYKAEEKNPHTETSGGKANTADCIIVNGSVDSFLKNMESKPVTFDSSGLCTLESGEKFYQVSLKKEEGGAQLGKITTDFTNKFGLLSNTDLLNLFIHESIDPQILDEGLKDLFNKGKEFIKSAGKKIIEKISSVSKKISSFFKGMKSKFKSATATSNKDGDDFLLSLVKKHKLNELNEKKKPKDMGVMETIRSISDKYNSGDKKSLQALVKKVNSLLTEVISLCGSPGCYYLTSVKKLTIPSKVDVDTVIKFLSNYKALTAFKTIIKNSKGDIKSASQIMEDFAGLEQDMYFGKTSLPLFKVFGLKPDGSGTAYKFLKTGKEFAEDRKKSFTESDTVDRVFLVYVQAKSGFGTMGAWMFSHINNNGEPLFNYTTFRTNQSGSMSFVIEGSQIKTWDWIKNNYGIK
jgi:hypothetical protein